MSKLTGRIITVVSVEDADAGRTVSKSLRALRELAGLTQMEMASRLHVGQGAISKMEHRDDLQISSLQKYVEALGAKLRIDATFPADAFIALQLQDAFDTNIPDENQLVFPIFGDDLFQPQRDVVLSIRPRYSEKIIQGEKTVELRRRFPVSAPSGTVAYIYSTSPVSAMVGSAEIAGVLKLPVSDIWKQYAKSAAMNKPEFESYFDGLNEGFALQFTNVRPLPRKIGLTELRHRFGFEPPQSFLYATPVLRSALRNEYSDIPN